MKIDPLFIAFVALSLGYFIVGYVLTAKFSTIIRFRAYQKGLTSMQLNILFLMVWVLWPIVLLIVVGKLANIYRGVNND